MKQSFFLFRLAFVALVWSSCQSTGKNEFVPESDDVDKWMTQEVKMTRDPLTNTVPRERMEVARSYMKTLESQLIASGRTTALSWTERGPNNVGGRTRAILVDKRDATGNTVFAGSVGGGIFKSTNFQSVSPTWSPVNDQMGNLAVTAMAQEPVNDDTLYAATGEGWFNLDAIKGGGIFRSVDGGVTWAQMSSTSGFEYIQDMIIDNNGNLYVALRNQTTANRGIMRSADKGATWTQVLGAPLVGFLTGRAADLEVASNGDVYASLGVFSRTAIWKSSFATHGANTGAVGNWTDITPVRTTVTQRTDIALAPSDAQRVYLVMQDSSNSQVSAIYRSSNGGNTWDSMPAPPALNNGGASQTWYNLIGAVDPGNADVLVVGGLNLARSTDAAATWTSITNSGTVHVDHHVLTFTSSSKLINANDGGIYASDNINGAPPSFTKKSSGYNVTQYYACDYHPTDVNYFLAGAQDNGTQKFTSPGMNSTTNATGGDGGYCHIDQTDGQIQITAFTGNQYGFSFNGGASFTPRSFNGNGQFINPTDYDDAQNVLYTGDNGNIYGVVKNLTSAAAATYTAISLPTMGNREATALKVDPNSADVLWLGCTGSAVPQILKLTGASTSPSVVLNSTLGAPAGAYVSSIDVEIGNSNHVLVTLSNFGVASVWESTDGGNTFTNIEGNLPDMPVRWGIFAPANAQLNGTGGGNGGILLGTELGIWTTSVTSGATTNWIPNNTGYANVSTYMLKLRPDNTVLAASHGRGLYTTLLPTATTGVPGITNTKDFIRYISAENGRLQIVRGTLTGTRTMDISLFDMSGKLVLRRNNRYETTSLDISALSRGSYVLKIRGDKNETFTKTFIR